MSFDLLAPHYRWMEFVLAGEKLQRCRTAFLDEIPGAQNILLLGEGHGRCLVECVRLFPAAKISCVDASQQMLIQARRLLDRRNAKSLGVEFIQADVLNWMPAGKSYDLIITNFFLDCFRAEQLEEIIVKLSAVTSPAANWLIADFQTASAGIRRIRSRLILWTMYLFFRTATDLPAKRLTAPDASLRNAGFRLNRRVESEWGLLHSEWWERKRNV